MHSHGEWLLGIDVGGTFTDALLYNSVTGDSYRAKTPSTPEDQAKGVLNAIDTLRRLIPGGGELQLTSLHHGTTVATNAILEGKGARVALFVTEGYRDVLQMRRSQVPGGLGGWVVYRKPEPLASLELTFEVPGRISTSGEEVKPFDSEVFISRLQAIKNLPDDSKPEAITVSLINSFANSSHEQAAADILRREFPSTPISLSSTILPELMEYERALTTVANAMVRPRVEKYLDSLQKQLDSQSGSAKPQICVLRSDGGLASVDLAKEFSSNLLYSGPAGGVTGVAVSVAGKTKYKNLLTFDMGGTSTDVCLIQNGLPSIRRETTVGDLTVRVPSVDVRTVGAGGGSVAFVPAVSKALRVGPESAGAVPGPACYGKGSTRATVTDANAVLGYLPPALLGGSFKLDIDAARAAVQEIAQSVGLSLEEAAEGILKLANEKMFGALRSVSVERGHDPREYSLVAFGGAGPMHACSLARLCGSYPSIIPPSPGVLCAFGDAMTTLRHEISRTYICNLSEVDVRSILDVCRELSTRASDILAHEGVPLESQKLSFQVDMRYQGQALNLPVGFALLDLEEQGFSLLEEGFTRIHEQMFTYALELSIEMINLRAIAEEKSRDVKVQMLGKSLDGKPLPEAIQSRTRMYWNGKTYTDVPVYNRSLLLSGDQIQGPAIITEMDSNTLVHPDHRAETDEIGNILLWPSDIANEQKGVPPAAHSTDSQTIVTQLIEAALANARAEMDGLIVRVAMSPAMREQLDYFPMIAAGEGPNEGKMVVGQFGSFIGQFLSRWTGTIEEGDVFITNDPYSIDGAISHLNDVLVILPVYHGGVRVGWAANLGHFTDIGGQAPGSLPINARTIFEDGVQIPLCKFYERDKRNDAVAEIIIRNSRRPDFARADLHALTAACRIAGRRIQEMCDRFGRNAYSIACAELLERNRTAFARLLKTNIPDAKMHFEDYMDDDGTGLGPWRVACTMFKETDEHGVERLVYDFDGTDPQADSSINWLLSETLWKMRSSSYLIKALDPTITVNDGAYDLMDVRIPLGTILKPIRPAALSCRTHLLGRTLDLVIGTLGQHQPKLMTAAGYSDSPHFFYSGYREDGSWYQLYQIGFGGIPGRPVGDGMDGHSLFPSMKTVPNEFLELYYPLRIEHYSTIPSSGGAGLHRGGNGVRIDYRFLAHGEISLHDDRWLTKPWGVNGGLPGARSRKTLIKYSELVQPSSTSASNPTVNSSPSNATAKVTSSTDPSARRIALPSKADFIRVAPGDVLEWCTWGGGGWGAPLARPATLVAKEVRAGLITREGAKTEYGVVLDARGWADEGASEALRERMLQEANEAKGRAEERDGGVINRGGTLKELFARCKEETGLDPPMLPSGRVLRPPLSLIPHIRELHARRQREDREEFGEMYGVYARPKLDDQGGSRNVYAGRGCC
ncbi:hypothetical protein M422DRAFT_241749 [Sphaerobolus stellatus SS14]|nr:hypothetical protein M422DRAFT_241749 [Sphaerobolus stellatus SS14]